MSNADSVATRHERKAEDLLGRTVDPRNPVSEATVAAVAHALLAISARIAEERSQR